MSLLERRLDNVVTRLGFASSRPQARQVIRHGHILVNGRKLDIPSYLVRPGDQIQVKNRDHSRKLVAGNLEQGAPPVPDWLDRVSDRPSRGPRDPHAVHPGYLLARDTTVDHRVLEPLRLAGRALILLGEIVDAYPLAWPRTAQPGYLQPRNT